jgi:DNA-binding IclR family transcriptional regulator
MQTIERTFAVLRAIAEGGESAGVSEVARRSGLAKSTTSRILASLDELGMIDRLDDRYVIGQGLAALTAEARPGAALRDVARPYLVDLADEFGESVALAVADGDEMVYIDTQISEGVVQVRDWTGERFPLHTTAAGLVLLADRSNAEVDRYGRGELEVFTDQTVASLTALRERVRQVRREGVAWTLAEFDDEINGIAAAVHDDAGAVVGAVNVSGPVYRFPGDRPGEEIVAALTAACAQITSRLGA